MILVTGGSGNVGGKLLHELAAGGARVRALTRDPARAGGFPDSTEAVVGDLDATASLTRAFEGVDRLFLLTPGIGVTQARNALAAAQAAGVQRIVLLSSDNVIGDPMPAMGQWHHEREQAVRESGMAWTILRPSGFMSNALQWVATMREGGYVLDPVGPGRHAVVDPADVAAVAAVVLTEGGHDGLAYRLTGPDALTLGEQVRILGEALGRAIDVREVVTPEEAVRARFPQGAPPALAKAIAEAFVLMRADTVGTRTDVVNRLLGRSPGRFDEWAARHAPAFAAALGA